MFFGQGAIRTLCWAFFLLLVVAVRGAEAGQATFRLTGPVCGDCLAAIHEEFAGREGLVALRVDQARGLLHVEYRPPLRGAELDAALGKMGFGPRLENGAAAPGPAREEPCPGCGTGQCGATVEAWKKVLRKFFPHRERE